MAEADTKNASTIQVPVGIAGVDMKTAERQVKAGEAPPLAPNAPVLTPEEKRRLSRRPLFRVGT